MGEGRRSTVPRQGGQQRLLGLFDHVLEHLPLKNAQNRFIGARP